MAAQRTNGTACGRCGAPNPGAAIVCVACGAVLAAYAPPAGSRSEAVASVVAAQDVLRAAVRRAIEDDVFRAKFDDAAAVRVAWPI